MPTPRNEETQSPYLQFNFTVELGSGITGGFQEVSGVGMEVAVTDYRNGTDRTNNVRKLNGLNKTTDVTFKRESLARRRSTLGSIKSGPASPRRCET